MTGIEIMCSNGWKLIEDTEHYFGWWTVMEYNGIQHRYINGEEI